MSQGNSNSLSMYPIVISCHSGRRQHALYSLMLYSAVSRYFHSPSAPSTNQLDLCLEMRASFASAKFNLLQFPLVASISLPFPASAHFHVRCKTEFRSSNRCWGRWRCGSCQLLRLYYLLCTYIERSQTHTQMHRDSMECTGSIERQRRHLPLLLFKAHLLLILPAACKASRTFPDILCVCVCVHYLTL